MKNRLIFWICLALSPVALVAQEYQELPGEGQTDYAEYNKLVRQLNGLLTGAPRMKQVARGLELAADAHGTQPFSYRWYFGATQLVPVAAPEGHQQVLVLTPPYIAGVYRCVISNSAGSTTSGTVRIATTTQADAADVTITLKQPKS